MTTAADLVVLGGEVHTLADPDQTASAVAVRDGRIVRVGDDYEIRFLQGVETRTVDLDGRVLLPGFIDAHTHLPMVGRYQLHANLRGVSSVEALIDALRGATGETGWVLGFGFDESGWAEPRPPTREDLDRVAGDRPVAAVREDMHTAVVNGAALDALGLAAGDPGVRTENGAPTGVLVEGAAEAVVRATAPDADGVGDLIAAGRELAHRRGVTGIHDMVRRPAVAGTYRRLDRAGELGLRVRLNYLADYLDAVEELGLLPNTGSEFLRTGAIKAFADGSIGSHTARLGDPYADGNGEGEWVTPPEELQSLVERVDGGDRQLAVHAIGDAAIGGVLDAVEAADADPGARHRVEHAELATDEQIERMAAAGVVASVQPNFHKWAGDGGLYEQRLGPRRAARTNRLAALREAGVELAFGSDCMPLDPLFGVHHAVNAPTADQRLPVTEALRAYTFGSARAGFDGNRLGTVEVGKRADFVALDRSPWECPGSIAGIDVAVTVVDGEVVFDGR